MAKERQSNGTPPEAVISIIGPGMRVVGDCETDGTVRVEGTVEGSIRAGKAVVVGKEGLVDGDVITQDAVISGRVVGTLTAESRLELQATCRIEGEVRARRMQLEEGALLNGTILMGENIEPPVLGGSRERDAGEGYGAETHPVVSTGHTEDDVDAATAVTGGEGPADGGPDDPVYRPPLG